jgi:SAM-dependent methyltransferase
MKTRRKPLGASKSLIDARWPFRLYRRVFGAEDMHSHYRWDAVSRYLDLRAGSTLEVGGGDGRISFEAVDRGLSGDVLLTEFDPASVAEAKLVAARGHYDNVMVTQMDLRQLSAERGFDQVLAVDVLEHIDDDRLALAEIAAVLVPRGRLVVSVPTPRYPLVFGRAFHEHLGHVRDGYWLEDLTTKLEEAGLRVESSHYYTGAWVSRACRLFYGSGVPYVVGVLWAPLVRPLLRRTERRARRETSASLALVAVRA